MTLAKALAVRRAARDYEASKLSQAAVSELLFAAQGITGPEERRTAPSAGAIHPLEVHLAAGGVEGLEAGIYRYHPKGHELSLSARGDLRSRIAADCLNQEWMAKAPLILVLSAIASRMTPKYGERSGRYILLEAGHVAQNVLLRAASLSLGAAPVGAFGDERLKQTLALSDQEAPLYLIAVGKAKAEAEGFF